MSLCFCAIAQYLKLKEHSDGKVVTELKKGLSKIKLAHSEEVQSLKAKLKKAKDKYLVGVKEWESKEGKFQEEVIILKDKAEE